MAKIKKGEKRQNTTTVVELESGESNNKIIFGKSIAVFVVTMLVVWFLLYTFRPNYVNISSEANGKLKGSVDTGKVVGISAFVAFIVTIIYFIIAGRS
jgi:uncharacterized membrane protein (DUF485 family)